ncbi:MAG: hypothetical protein JWL67_367, partial [Solirubrobacterales bacterium]|nr:hypothetical protein [Solirubrobacterales bacterium]
DVPAIVLGGPGAGGREASAGEQGRIFSGEIAVEEAATEMLDRAAGARAR